MKHTINKTGYTLILISFLICSLSVANEQFIADINYSWSQTNYAQLFSTTESRINTITNDVCAHAVMMYYYLFAERNLTNARVNADQLTNAVFMYTTNATTRDYAVEMRNEVYSIPLHESTPLSIEQMVQLHQLFPDMFPMINQCVAIQRLLLEEPSE